MTTLLPLVRKTRTDGKDSLFQLISLVVSAVQHLQDIFPSSMKGLTSPNKCWEFALTEVQQILAGR